MVMSQAQPTTAGSWLHGIRDMLVSAGMDPAPIFADAGIPAEHVGDPHQRIQSDQLSRLWNVITAVSGDEAISLASSDCPRPATLDLLTYTMMTAPNLDVALQRFVRYLRVISDAARFALVPDGARGTWLTLSIAGGELPVPRQRGEFILITILNICRWISGRPVNPTAVEFEHEEPGSTQAHARAFAGPLTFSARRNGLLISAADLAAPLPAANVKLSEMHEKFACDFLDRMDGTRITPRVRDIIVRSLPDGDPPRGAAAAALCISERTLQRRLREEGTSYQDLVDHTRRELAREYLGKEQMALGQVAFMLGFADQSTFCRACQRWFNTTPKQYRKRLSDA
ncbi:transcriptional regulator, AraC family [Pseudoduganella namucuonensis]|uniref:Transcriptional regulator, AraC family n=2 Tax=Pseudoduganella namucuonensis TaxID=1035707 RepID=A0A1I7IYV7_9BURK|nr:transcriptional regulator, AraC family [Pseudoduganella namucuonensis]